MMTDPLPDQIDTLLLETQKRIAALREVEAHLVALRDLLRPTPTPAPPTPAPSVPSPRESAGRPRPRRATPAPSTNLQERILTLLSSARTPVRIGNVASAVGVSGPTLRRALARLVAAGQIVCEGQTTKRTVRLATVAPPAPTAPTPTPAEATAQNEESVVTPRLVGEITRMLKTGSSQSPRELHRGLSMTGVGLETVVAACEQMTRSGTVERIRISDAITRYRAVRR